MSHRRLRLRRDCRPGSGAEKPRAGSAAGCSAPRAAIVALLLVAAVGCAPSSETPAPGRPLFDLLATGTFFADGTVLDLSARPWEREPVPLAPLAAPLEGWSEPESWGAWALGESASAMLELLTPRDAELVLEAYAAEHPEGRPQRVGVRVGGRELGVLEVTGDVMSEHRLAVPAAALRRGANRVELAFAHHVEPGDDPDPRPRALAVRRLALVAPGETFPSPAGDEAWKLLPARETLLLLRSGSWLMPWRVTADASALELALEIRGGDTRALEAGFLTLDGVVHPVAADDPASGAADAGRRRLDLSGLEGRRGVLFVRVVLPAGGRLVVASPRLLGKPGADDDADQPAIGEPAAASAPAATRAGPIDDDGRPDLVLIVLDAARADHFGAYGYRRDTTPTIDRLAAAGWVFERVFAECPYTTCSSASLLLGLPFTRHGVVDNRLRAAAEIDALAERLRALGYRTIAYSANPNNARAMGLDQGFDEFHEVWRRDDDGRGRADPHPRRLTEMVETRLGEDSGDGPLFLFLHYVPPHEPYDPDPEHDLFGDPAYAGMIDPEDRKLLRDVYRGRVELAPADLERLVALYDGNLRMADAHVARILDTQRRAGRLDSAAVVVTSDHGEAFYEHGAIGHNTTLYDEMLRVPLIVRPPPGIDRRPPRLDRLASLYHLAPTLLDLAGAPAGDVEGSLLAPPAHPEDRVVVLRSNLRRRPLYGLRGVRFKLIAGAGRRHELYDLVADPEERVDLAAERPFLAAAWSVLLARALDGPPEAAERDAPLTDEEREMLESLGYL